MNEKLAFWVAVAALFTEMTISAVRLALNELSPGTLRKLENSHPELAGKFSRWYDRRERYRISLRMLQAIVIVGFLMAGGFWLQSRIGNGERLDAGVFTAVLAGALAYFLTTELFGCALGKAWSRELLRIGMPLARCLTVPLIPVVWPIETWHLFLARRRMAGEKDEEKTTTEDEIMSLVEKDERGKTSPVSLEEDERRMIRGIFDLDETLVREIMTPRVDLDSASVNSTPVDIRNLIVKSGHSRIPIYAESIDQVVGIIHAKDLLAAGDNLDRVGIMDLIHPPIFIPESKNVGDLLGEFQEKTTHCAIVVDEYGGTAGVVTLEDILEEIVGEIRDEYDREEEPAPTRVNGQGVVILDARTPICDVNDMLDTDIPDDEDFDTLGGYVSYLLGHIPKAGEVVKTDEVEVEVVEADERRVLRAKVQRVEPDDNQKSKSQDDD